jgi:hypothetical protein
MCGRVRQKLPFRWWPLSSTGSGGMEAAGSSRNCTGSGRAAAGAARSRFRRGPSLLSARDHNRVWQWCENAGTPCGDKPCSFVARPRQGRRSARPAHPNLRLVQRGLRRSRPTRCEGTTRRPPMSVRVRRPSTEGSSSRRPARAGSRPTARPRRPARSPTCQPSTTCQLPSALSMPADNISEAKTAQRAAFS